MKISQENQIKELQKIIEEQKNNGKSIVWTNGCFDIIHPGHLETFKKAKEIGDILIVGLNGKDSPYWKTKPGRPINDEIFRAKMLEGLVNVDYIYIFNDETPARPVNILKPDFVLKGGDYYIKEISKDFIEKQLENKKNILRKFNEIVEKNLVDKKENLIDITKIYSFFVKNNLFDDLKNYPGFMQEGYVNVQNGGKVVLVPVVGNYSTTKIVEKIRPKKFFDLVMFWKNNKKNFGDLKNFIEWFGKKLEINYFYNKYDKIKLKKFQIYMVNLGKNIGGEINKIRPVVILGNTRKFLSLNTILIAPLTDLYNKKGKKKKLYFGDILIKKNEKNGLSKDSILRLSKIKEISKKRVIYYLGKLEKKHFKDIDDEILNIFGIKK